MLQSRGCPDLMQEAIGSERRGQIAAQDLEGYAAIVTRVVSQVDRGHAAGPEFRDDRVGAEDGAGSERGLRIHSPRIIAVAVVTPSYCGNASDFGSVIKRLAMSPITHASVATMAAESASARPAPYAGVNCVVSVVVANAGCPKSRVVGH